MSRALYRTKLVIFILLSILVAATFGCARVESKSLGQFPSKIEAEMPIDIAFTKDKLFFAQLNGELKFLKRGSDELETVRTFDVPDQDTFKEAGVLGMALSPSFTKRQYIYLYQSYQDGDEVFNRVIRINAERPDERPFVVIDGIRGARNHNSGKIAFGKDGKLYIAAGDSRVKNRSQDVEALEGKILRVNADGSIPGDNPFDNAVWSIGHRNMFGMAFQDNGKLLITENGATVNDEINEIVRGGNYGWPIVTGESDDFRNPVKTYNQVIAPTGLIIYKGDRYPELIGKPVFADYLNGIIRVLEISDKRVDDRIIADFKKGVIALAESPDGYIYAATEDSIVKVRIRRKKIASN